MKSDTFYGEADDALEDVYYQRNQPLNRRYNNNNRGRSNRSRRGGRSYERGVLKRHKNPIDSILMVTFPDVEFVNPSIIGKTIALITLMESPKIIQKKQCFTNPCFILKNSCNNLLDTH